MSSWPVIFYPRPLIWTATHLTYLNIVPEITGLFDELFIRLCRSLDQNGCNPHIWLNKICSIISCSWPWPILTLLRRSGERLRTFRSSSLKNYFRDTIKVSNSLDSDQAQPFVGPDLDPNCFQSLSADDTGR